MRKTNAASSGVTMASKRELHAHQLSRFHRIARRLPVTNDLLRSPYWENIADAFFSFGDRLNSKIAALFSPLSDDEMAVACQALLYAVTSDDINVINKNFLHRIGDKLVVVRSAEVIAILSPTYVRVAAARLNSPLSRLIHLVTSLPRRSNRFSGTKSLMSLD